MADEKPTPEQVTNDFNEILNWIAVKIAEIQGKLPAGVVLSDSDLQNIVLQGVGKFGPDLLTSLVADLAGAIKTGKGPNVFDNTFLA